MFRLFMCMFYLFEQPKSREKGKFSNRDRKSFISLLFSQGLSCPVVSQAEVVSGSSTWDSNMDDKDSTA